MLSTEEFKRCAQEYMDMVFRVAFSCLRSQADAEDVTQEVLLRLYESDYVFESRAHIKNWLVKVTYNECRKFWRRLWRRKEKMKKAFQNLKAPEDTLERVMETMRRKELGENMRSEQSARVGQSVRTKRLTLVLVAVLVLTLGCGSVYAVKGFSLGALFGQSDAKAELGAAQQAPGMGADIDTDMDAARGSGAGADADMNADAEVNTSFKISCPFAFENPYVENAEAHDGVDFVADRGTPVLAAADGKVRALLCGFGKIMELSLGVLDAINEATAPFRVRGVMER